MQENFIQYCPGGERKKKKKKKERGLTVQKIW
jgi:hypothetical protein